MTTLEKVPDIQPASYTPDDVYETHNAMVKTNQNHQSTLDMKKASLALDLMRE